VHGRMCTVTPGWLICRRGRKPFRTTGARALEKTGDETIQPNKSAKPEGSGAGHRSGHAGTKAQTMNTTRTPAGGPGPEKERPFAPVREVMSKTELSGTRYPLRIRQELTGDEDEEVDRP